MPIISGAPPIHAHQHGGDSFDPLVNQLFYHKDGVASEVVVLANDTERTKTDSSYVNAKEVTMKMYGTLRTYFEILTSNATYTAYGRIYKNDNAVGTERSTTLTAYTGYWEDLTFAVDDKYQVYVKINAGATVFVRRQRILGGFYGELTSGK